MNLNQIEKKLREAEFFLGKMQKQESRAFGDKEPFDFCLSAFLNAARTVDYRLRHEQAATYPSWRTAWDARLAHNEKSLIKFLVDNRNVEVHVREIGYAPRQRGGTPMPARPLNCSRPAAKAAPRQ
jgi:hypothetical protein